MFIDVTNGKLFTSHCGPADGTAILAIGGWIGSSELWLEPFASLSRSFLTISYDHRGSGLTICPTDSITFDNLVADAIAVLDAYGIRRCALAAESAGAQTALAVAARFPERISQLVIVDGMYSSGVTLDADPFLRGLRSNYSATIEWFVQLCLPEPDSEHIKLWGRKILARAEPEAAIELRVVSVVTDVAEDIGRVKQPTLVLHGALDKVVPLAQGRALAEMLCDAELVVLDGAGHVPTLTQGSNVASLINDFLVRREA